MGKLMPLFSGPFEIKREVFHNCYELVVPGTNELVGRQNMSDGAVRNSVCQQTMRLFLQRYRHTCLPGHALLDCKSLGAVFEHQAGIRVP
ncbi:hypothetical protein PR048_004704 [Dryococelus australis]|uniref:Uncharacterized protein n=1 Tax=Dryococelus australis TaxID=614101 RepID=A0ABQ9I663_9NEOP|nr:hypothetical protein PR048_004704 [Dryococelus australis]